jgi:hypothetical protein
MPSADSADLSADAVRVYVEDAERQPAQFTVNTRNENPSETPLLFSIIFQLLRSLWEDASSEE